MAESSDSSGAVALATVFNGSAPGANTGILTTAVTPSPSAVAIRLSVVLTASSVFNLTIYNGTTTHKVGLNSSVALNAADLYTFTFGARAADQSANTLAYNFEVESDGVVEYLMVEEISGGVV